MKSTCGPDPFSPPFPYPLPTLLGGGHIRRRGRSGRRHCGVPPCGGVAGRGVEAALPPSLPLQEEARHGGGQARPARLREGRGCLARRRAAPSLPSPTSRTGHDGDQAWPARLELAERRADLQPRGADRSRSRRRSRAPSAQASPALRASLASKICAPSEGPSLGSGRLQPPPPAPPTPLPIPRHNLKERNTRPPQSQVPHVALPSNPFKDQW